MKVKRTSSNELITKSLVNWMTVALFLDAYCFIYIGNYPVTLFTIAMVSFIIYGLFAGKIKVNGENKSALFVMVYLVANFLFTGFGNPAALLLSFFYFVTFILVKKNKVENCFSMFSKLSTCMALYGIYQIVARYAGLPFTDLIWKNHMVEGFNWTNNVYVGSLILQRSNGILREPSALSQLLSINLLLLIQNMFSESKNSIKNTLIIVINLVGLVCTFSGTGFLILSFAGLLYLVKYYNKNKKLRKYILILFPLAILVLIKFSSSTLGEYLYNRFLEMGTYSSTSYSGYVRFLGSFEIVKYAWSDNFLIGTGIGSYKNIISILDSIIPGITINGFTRPAAELGLVGICLWLYFLLNFYKREKKQNPMLSFMIFPYMFCLEAFLSNAFWYFLYVLKFSSKNEVRKSNGSSTLINRGGKLNA